MPTEASKKVITDYFGAIDSGDFETAMGLFADDVTWWVPPSSPMAGTYEGKASVLEMFGKGTSLYAPEPMRAEVLGLTAEGDRVAAEVIIRAKTAKGGEYSNYYHFLFTTADGKIQSVREHVDTLYAQRTLFE